MNLNNLNTTAKKAAANYNPPEELTVSKWADKYRRLSPENSAEAGPWRTSRVPYMKEIMDAFTDPKIKKIAVAASSQVSKTEVLQNMLGYVIDIDPGPALFIMPTVDIAQEFSKRRFTPMIRDNRRLTKKVADYKSRESSNTILKKTYPGGMLTMLGANSPSGLASTPAKYVFGDERDRWPISAGAEGDPWALAEARTVTFYNSKMVEVSTPTIKDMSAIERSFYLGTRERWCHQCPECGNWHQIVFANLKMDYEPILINQKKDYRVNAVQWICPSCACLISEEIIRKQPAKWIAENPSAYENGMRSFWLNGFSSPWLTWKYICLRFLQAGKDPEKLKPVFNTLLGELWEERGDIEDEGTILARREEYNAEVPEGALILTCGVDTQDNRLEYEVVGHGKFGEKWGIEKGVIVGHPDNPEVWERLDDVLDKTYMHECGKGLLISMTCVDSGGHYTQEVYRQCAKRQAKNVYAIKGRGGDGIPFTQPPKRTNINIDGKYIGSCWLYTIGVDAGKASIMTSLKVQNSGAKYYHFPSNKERGYDAAYFNGLLSEKKELRRSSGRDKWTWVRIPGHPSNEPLDCRNYANAALELTAHDMDALERRLKGGSAIKQQPKQKVKRKSAIGFSDW